MPELTHPKQVGVADTDPRRYDLDENVYVLTGAELRYLAECVANKAYTEVNWLKLTDHVRLEMGRFLSNPSCLSITSPGILADTAQKIITEKGLARHAEEFGTDNAVLAGRNHIGPEFYERSEPTWVAFREGTATAIRRLLTPPESPPEEP